MRDIQFDKNERRFWVMLLALVCISFLSFSSDIGNGSSIQANQNPILDIFVQYIDFSPGTQRLLSEEQLSRNNNSYMATLYGLSCDFFFLTNSSFIYLSSQIPVCKIKYFLIVSYSPHAPPYTLA